MYVYLYIYTYVYIYIYPPLSSFPTEACILLSYCWTFFSRRVARRILPACDRACCPLNKQPGRPGSWASFWMKATRWEIMVGVDCRPNNKIHKVNSGLVLTYEVKERGMLQWKWCLARNTFGILPSSSFKHLESPKVILCIIVVRQVAAYLLDHKHFAGVPPTTLVHAKHPAFVNPNKKVTRVCRVTSGWIEGEE